MINATETQSKPPDWKTRVTPIKDTQTKTLILTENHLYKRAHLLLISNWTKPEDANLRNFKAYAHQKPLFEKYLGFGYKVVFNYKGKEYLLIFNRE